MNYSTVDDLNIALVKHLADSGYAEKYQDEDAFEADVWARVVKFMSQFNREKLREIFEKICRGSETSIIAVP